MSNDMELVPPGLENPNHSIVNRINISIGNFIGKHPENVSTWIDGKNTIIQISNVGIRDPLFYDLSYLVENTTIEDKLKIFNMPAKCVIANERIARFVCTVYELVEYIKSQDSASEPSVSPVIKKFTNRLSSSHAFKRAEEIVLNNEDSSKIKVYIIGNPESHYQNTEGQSCAYVTWTVIDIIQIDAGTTWENEALRNRLSALKASSNIPSNMGKYGSFNIAFKANNENLKTENGTLIGRLPEFILSSSIKIGDIIDSRNYVDADLWSSPFNYQTSDNDYQKFDEFYNDTLDPYKEPFGQTLIPDGAIITI